MGTINKEAASTSTASAPEWSIRFYREGDIPGLVRLLRAAEDVDHFGTRSTTEEALAANYNQPMSEPPKQVLVAEGPSTEGVPHGVARVMWIDEPGADDLAGWEVGTLDTEGLVRSERLGRGDGRVYALRYEARDLAGNVGSCTAAVRVPHDRR